MTLCSPLDFELVIYCPRVFPDLIIIDTAQCLRSPGRADKRMNVFRKVAVGAWRDGTGRRRRHRSRPHILPLLHPHYAAGSLVQSTPLETIKGNFGRAVRQVGAVRTAQSGCAAEYLTSHRGQWRTVGQRTSAKTLAMFCDDKREQ